jgi:sugar lactone lactonase YvrE
MNPKVILEAHAGIGESPFWHAAHRALFWVDIPARKVHSYDPTDGSTQSWSVPATRRLVQQHIFAHAA